MRTIEDILAGRLKETKVDVDQILHHHLIADFQRENEISSDMLRRSLPKLSKYIQEQEQCMACVGLEACPNLIGGHCSQLVGYEGYIDIQSRKCAKQEAYEEAEKRRRLSKVIRFQKMSYLPLFKQWILIRNVHRSSINLSVIVRVSLMGMYLELVYIYMDHLEWAKVIWLLRWVII